MTPADRRLASLLFLSLGVLLQFGEISPLALSCVLLSLGFAIHSFSAKPLGSRFRPCAGTLLVLALAGTTTLYDHDIARSPVFLITFAGLAVAILILTTTRTRTMRTVAFGLAASSTGAALATSMRWGIADIDVFHFQQSAAQALLHGQNPYSPLVGSPQVIAPGVAARIPLHLPYGPIVPVLESPFRLAGDVRLLHIVAALLTAMAVLALGRRAGTFDRTACLVVAFPLTVGMVSSSWIDIIAMAGVAIWIVSFRTSSRIAIFALVLALGAKPTTLVALVPIFFWSARARRQVVLAGSLAVLLALPFAIATGFSQFYYDILGVQVAGFPRLDALTIDSYLNSLRVPILPFAVSAGIVGTAALMVLRRRPADYGELLTGTAILATVSFLTAKWAYFNYYYIPAVLLMLAIAGDGLALDAPERIHPPAIVIRSVELLRQSASWLPNARGLADT